MAQHLDRRDLNDTEGILDLVGWIDQEPVVKRFIENLSKDGKVTDSTKESF